ncbi:MAG: ATP-binding protein [Planctomycetota bacterium]|nr:ATP-binding protein [Planctomycetota bacterium]
MPASDIGLYSLRTRLALMMGLIFGATLSLLYLLNLQAERDILGTIEKTVSDLEDDLNDAEEKLQKQREARERMANRLARDRREFWPATMGRQMREMQGFFRNFQKWENMIVAEFRRKSGKTPPRIIRLNVTGRTREVARPSIPGPRVGTVAANAFVTSRPKAITGGGETPSTAETDVSASPYLPASVSGVSEIPVDVEPVKELIAALRLRNILIVVGVFVVGVLLAWLLASRFTAPLREMKVAFGRVAAGDLSGTPLPRRRDEIGQIGESFRAMVGKLKENRDLEKQMFDQERFSAMGHLAAGVAHDVRNPLNAIGLTIDYMQDEFCPEDPEKMASFLRFTAAIRGEIARLNSLVNNFLSLARPASLDVKPNDLNGIVRDLLELVQTEAESRGIAISVDLQSDLPAVTLDAERIRAALMNLILNAIQATDRKGEIHVGTRAVGRDAQIIIRDTGRGIDPKDVERVFMPYYTTREEGTGLGLTVSRVTMEGHGGRIDMISQLGKGTTVTAVLPLLGPESDL